MKFVFLAAFLFLTSAHAYKFLCNGITAEGVTESDGCHKSCTAEPSRWPGPTVTYNIDISVLPAGVSASDWLDVVNGSFNAWAATPGTNLLVSNGGNGGRSFGTSFSDHDIFWVTSELEWMQQVGAGPEGILGVTLPQYACPTSTVLYRQIDDADMILNAVPSAGFTWAPGCAKLSADCQSARATVAHESGHFLGLGHPCASCQELMSAQAEYLIEYPLFDDQQGMAALYPDTSKAGSFGTICSNSARCKTGLTCHSQSGTQYCSSTCSASTGCGNNMVCGTSKYCEFPAGTQLGAVGLLEDCMQNPCDTNLICVGVSDTAAYCYADCTMGQTCLNSETCHQLKNSQYQLISSYACMVMVKQGDACGGTTVCQSGLKCISGTCTIDTTAGNFDVTAGSGGSGSGTAAQSCSSAKAPSEIWLLLLLMGILVHRPKKKC